MEDTGGSSGHPQAADVSSSVGVTGIGKLWETRLRGGGKGAPLQGGGGGGGEGRGWRKVADTLSREVSVCAI